MTDTTETEILDARRAFPEAQRLLAGTPTGDFSGVVDVGWHGQSVSPESGAFAVADIGGPFDDERFVGEVLSIAVDGGPRIFVYLVGRADLTVDLSLSRRAFLALALLKHETITATVEIVS